jgi:hypothetical protein
VGAHTDFVDFVRAFVIEAGLNNLSREHIAHNEEFGFCRKFEVSAFFAPSHRCGRGANPLILQEPLSANPLVLASKNRVCDRTSPMPLIIALPVLGPFRSGVR